MNAKLILLLSCSLMLGCEPKKKDSSMNDNERIEGTWLLVSGERHGQAFSDEIVKAVSLEFSGDTLSTNNRDHVSKATFVLHSDTSPKGIDLDMDGSVGLGIYELGGDTLKVLHGEVGDERPSDFGPEQSRLTLLVLKRKTAD